MIKDLKMKKEIGRTLKNCQRYRNDFRAISAAFQVQRILLIPHIVQW